MPVPCLLLGLLLGIAIAKGSQSEAFIQACKRGDLESVRGLVAGVDLGYKSKVEDEHLGLSGTALMFACYYGHLNVSRFLLASGADVNQQSNFGATALYCASWANRTDICRLLIREHADLELSNKLGWTALFAAARFDSLGAAKVLVEAGAEVEARDTLGRTPLVAASEAGSVLVARYLIETVHVNTGAHTTLGRTWIDVADIQSSRMASFVRKHKPNFITVLEHAFSRPCTWYTIVLSFLATVIFSLMTSLWGNYYYIEPTTPSGRRRMSIPAALNSLRSQERILIAKGCIDPWKYYARTLQYFVDIIAMVVFPFGVCLTLMTPALFFPLVFCLCSAVLYQQHQHSGIVNVLRKPALLLQPRADEESDLTFRLMTVVAIVLLAVAGCIACAPSSTKGWNIKGEPLFETECHGKLSNHKAWHFIAPESSKTLWPVGVEFLEGAEVYHYWIWVLVGVTTLWACCLSLRCCQGPLRPHNTLDYDKYREAVRRYQDDHDVASLMSPLKIFFEVGLWLTDLLLLDLMNIVLFLKSHHFKFAFCLLTAFMVSTFDVLKRGGPRFVFSAVRDSLANGLLTEELDQVIMHDRSFEVPLFLAVTAYALPFGARETREIFQTIFSICVMSYSMAKFLVENELAAYTGFKEVEEEEKHDSLEEEESSLTSEDPNEETVGSSHLLLCCQEKQV